MENELEEIEKKLRELSPRRPSVDLKARLSNELDAQEFGATSRGGFEKENAKPERRGNVIWGTTFTALVSAIAAVWAVLLVLDHRTEPSRMAGEIDSIVESEQSGPAEVSFEVAAKPVQQYATLVGAEPSPVFYLDDGQAVQRVALRYLDTEVWEMEGSEETFTVRSMRDEIRVIPAVSF